MRRPDARKCWATVTKPLPAPDLLVLSTLDLLLVDDTDVVEDVESLRALRASPARPRGPAVERDGPVLVPSFDTAARDRVVLVFVVEEVVVEVLDTTRDAGAVRVALEVVEPLLLDIPVPERFDVVELDVVELCNARERVGVDRFLSSSLLVLPDDL